MEQENKLVRIEHYTPKYLTKVVARKNTIDILKQPETLSVAKLKKHKGENEVKKVIALLLADLLAFLNLKDSLTSHQVDSIIELIMSEYYYLYVEELALIFKRVKLGLTGNIYNRIDGQIVMSWFNCHVEERHTVSEEKNIIEHHKNKFKGFGSERTSDPTKEIEEIRQANLKYVIEKQNKAK